MNSKWNKFGAMRYLGNINNNANQKKKLTKHGKFLRNQAIKSKSEENLDIWYTKLKISYFQNLQWKDN